MSSSVSCVLDSNFLNASFSLRHVENPPEIIVNTLDCQHDGGLLQDFGLVILNHKALHSYSSLCVRLQHLVDVTIDSIEVATLLGVRGIFFFFFLLL